MHTFSEGVQISWRGAYFEGTNFLKGYNFSLISQCTYFGIQILSLEEV